MSIKIAGVDLFSQGLDNEYRITILEMIIEELLKKKENSNFLTEQKFEKIKKEARILLQKKYPQVGIKEDIL